MNRFPWGTLALLLPAYTLLGGILSGFIYPWGILLFALGWITLRILVFIAPDLNLENWLYRCFRSNTLGFTTLVIAAALVSIVVIWLHIFYNY
ncbi:hypothetical protein NC981_23180 [Leptolyngbya sp. DQ-M1]